MTLICLGYRGERVFYPDAPLVGAAQIKEWIETKSTRCGCGATHCDVKLRLRNPEVLD